jgi:FtsZ-binding cell division protein ZapB
MSLEFLDLLETRVAEAVGQLESLRGENEELRRQVSELQAELERGHAQSAAAWRREREEVKKRVERLVDRLAGLAAAPAGGTQPLV